MLWKISLKAFQLLIPTNMATQRREEDLGGLLLSWALPGNRVFFVLTALGKDLCSVMDT
jgi:hypothetical protein